MTGLNGATNRKGSEANGVKSKEENGVKPKEVNGVKSKGEVKVVKSNGENVTSSQHEKRSSVHAILAGEDPTK